jgi:peptidase E
VVKQIIAIGGMALPADLDNLLLIDYFLRQTRKRNPRVCFIGTAGGDSETGRLRFYAGFSRFDCVPTHLPLFARTPRDLASFVLGQDAIFVGGGNTRRCLRCGATGGSTCICARPGNRVSFSAVPARDRSAGSSKG